MESLLDILFIIDEVSPFIGAIWFHRWAWSHWYLSLLLFQSWVMSWFLQEYRILTPFITSFLHFWPLFSCSTLFQHFCLKSRSICILSPSSFPDLNQPVFLRIIWTNLKTPIYDRNTLSLCICVWCVVGLRIMIAYHSLGLRFRWWPGYPAPTSKCVLPLFCSFYFYNSYRNKWKT